MSNLTLQTLSFFKLDELKDQKTLSAIEESVIELNASSDMGELYSLFSVLQAKVDAWSEVYDQYKPILIKMRFMTLPLQILDDILVLLQNNLLEAVNYNINLYDKIILRFLLKDRNVFMEEQKKMLSALLDSNESVQSGDRVIYIRDLLREYDEYIKKIDDPAHFIEIHKDIFANKDIREVLLYVLNLYEWLFFYETGQSSVSHKIQFSDTESNKSEMDYTNIIDEIIRTSNLNITDELLVQRTKNIILSRLRHIRDIVDVKMTLSKQIEFGGVGLDDATCNVVVANIERNINQIEKQFSEQHFAGYVPTSTDHILLMPPLPTVMATEEPVYNIVAEKNNQPSEQMIDSILIPTPSVLTESSINMQPALTQTKDVIVDGVSDAYHQSDKGDDSALLLADKPVQISTPVQIPVLEHAPVPKIVRPVKMINPITALGLIDLVEFRKMNSDPKIRTDEILSKIKLLGKDSYIKMFDSITAWQNSTLNRLYLSVAQRSILAAQSPEKIISNNNTEEDLNIDEFMAILSLNLRLNSLI